MPVQTEQLRTLILELQSEVIECIKESGPLDPLLLTHLQGQACALTRLASSISRDAASWEALRTINELLANSANPYPRIGDILENKKGSLKGLAVMDYTVHRNNFLTACKLLSSSAKGLRRITANAA